LYIFAFAYSPYVAPCNFVPSFSSCFVSVTVPFFLIFFIFTVLSFSFLLKYVFCVASSYPFKLCFSCNIYVFPHSKSSNTIFPLEFVVPVDITFPFVSFKSNTAPDSGTSLLLEFKYSSILYTVMLPFSLWFSMFKCIFGTLFSITASCSSSVFSTPVFVFNFTFFTNALSKPAFPELSFLYVNDIVYLPSGNFSVVTELYFNVS